MANTTTTQTLPKEVQEVYEIDTLEGGPRFDLPKIGFYGLDFSRLTLDEAALLLRRKWPHIRAKKVAVKQELPK